VSRWTVPTAAVLLIAAAAASDLIPALAISAKTVQWIASAALVVILYDGGASIGLRRFRVAAVPIASLGILGTFATAGLLTVFVHLAFGLPWLTSGLLAAAVSPTDPAVVFSVLGPHGIHGRTGTILEGESGANDPVGIALMLGLIQLATHDDATFWVVVWVFVLQMGVGLAVGIAAGYVARRVLGALVVAAAAFAVAYLAHGSGFLAVFVAGLIAGRPFEAEKLPKAAEIVAFVALGLTVSLSGISGDRWVQGLVLAAFLALVARPVVVGALLMPVRLRAGERTFVIWAGLKGAVPILLGSLTLVHHVHDAQRIFETVFVVVLASVVVQGGTVPYATRRTLVVRPDTRTRS
jgi:cell volume regulation protein A